MATIKGKTWSETIPGTNDNDSIDGNGGSDFIDGKAGIDTAVFFGNSSDFTVTDLSGVVRVTGLDSAPSNYRGYTVKLVNVENVQFLDSTNALPPPSNNIILNKTWSETISGTSGNDSIDGNGGHDFIGGGAGIDTAVFFGNSSDFTVTDLSGVVRVTGLDSAPSNYRGYTVKLVNVENVQFLDSTNALPPPSNNIILNKTWSETISGTSGNDSIDGNGGHDFIGGGAGIDTAVFFGNSSDFTVTDLSGVVRVTGLDSAPSNYRGYTAELVNVEKLQFLNKTFSRDVSSGTEKTTGYSVSPASASISENTASQNFTITRSGDLAAETVYVSTTFTEGFANNNDYKGILNKAVSFSAGATSAGVTVEIVNDASFEKNETFGLIVQKNANDPASTYLAKSTFTITDDDNNTNPAPKPDNTIAPTNAETGTINTNPSGIQTSASSKFARWKFETLLPPHIERSTWDLNAVDQKGNVFDGELVFETAFLAENDINAEGYFDFIVNKVTPYRIDFDAKLGMGGTFNSLSTNLSLPGEGIVAVPQFEGKFSSDYQSLTGKWFGTEVIPGTWSATLTETNTLNPEPNLDKTAAPTNGDNSTNPGTKSPNDSATFIISSSELDFPVLGAGWSHTSGSAYHRPVNNAGIKFDDTFALDLNLNKPLFNSDDGMDVRPVESGKVIETNAELGLVLVEHNTPLRLDDNKVLDVWYSGYLHMEGIIAINTLVNSGGKDILGKIDSKGADNEHLHFAIYELNNGVYESIDIVGQLSDFITPITDWF
jgi:Calx-beta domain/RTX calcium-binding nonapeptide repeat (4 copies)